MTPPIRVLIVDDSAFTRKVIRDALGGAAGIEVVGHARDGLEALTLIDELEPDVMTLDIHMPQLGGLGVLEALEGRNTPKTIVVSTIGAEDDETLRALELGAIDVVHKPTSGSLSALYDIRAELVAKVRVATVAAKVPRRLPPPRPVPSPPVLSASRTKVLVIGASTGGPQALTYLLPQLPRGLPLPVALVLHIPEGFTKGLADRLDRASEVEVLEAADGLVVRAGQVAIAPARTHLLLEAGAAGEAVCRLSPEPREALHRPSVNRLFESASVAFGGASLGVILTGMGEDGLEGCRAIRAAGGTVLTETESSCVVYGMPRAVVEAGLSSEQVPLSAMAEAIVRRLR